MEPKRQEWNVNADHAIRAKFPKFQAKHPKEFNSLFSNLDRITDLLRSNKWGSFHVGFFRSEGEGGVYRIGQTSVAHAKESRLYVFPEPATNTIYILTIGDKDTQDSDIIDAKRIVKDIRRAREVPS